MKLETIYKLISVGFTISDGHKGENKTCAECTYEKDNGYTKIQIYDIDENINPEGDLYEVYVKKEIGKEFVDRNYYFKVICTYLEEKDLIDFIMDKIPSSYFPETNIKTKSTSTIDGHRVDW